MAHARGPLAWLVLVALGVLGSRCQAERDCRVSSFKVQPDFDKHQVGDSAPLFFLSMLAFFSSLLDCNPLGAQDF